MKYYTWKQKARYYFDLWMSKGTISHILALFLIALLLLLIISAILTIIKIDIPGYENISFVEIFWMSLMRSLDPGTMGDDQGWSFRLAMLLVTISGLLIISTLIGVLTTGIERALTELSKGKSLVIEQNHTIILGWSQQIFSMINELIIANENQKRSSVVILAEKDKVTMEDEIRHRIGDTKNTRIICRSGNPVDIRDLSIVNPDHAKSIIITSPKDDFGDAKVIKSVLAITNKTERKKERYHIVAEIREAKNLEAAKVAGKGEATYILTDDLIARIAAQTCRQTGLSSVYTELLDFSGDEIYFKFEPSLVGKTFDQAIYLYRKSTLIGIERKNGEILINPPYETSIYEGDWIIAISEDDDTILMDRDNSDTIDYSAINKTPNAVSSKPEKTLIFGWNRRAHQIIHELDQYAPPGSLIHVIADPEAIKNVAPYDYTNLVNCTFNLAQGNTTDRRILENAHPENYDHIIILSYLDLRSPNEADAASLITLLHLRDIAQNNNANYSIVTEMLDIQNRELAKIAKADDFIVSDKLVSLLLTQLSENKELINIFEQLFTAKGAEVYLKPAGDYVIPGREVNFYTISYAARRKGETALGYRLSQPMPSETNDMGICINPDKSNVIALDESDKIIVLAES